MTIDFDNGLVVGLTLAGKNGLIGVDVSVVTFTTPMTSPVFKTNPVPLTQATYTVSTILDF